MVKIKQSPKLPAEERRMQLLMAAQKIFAQKGYKEATTEEIAREAGLTKGAIYFHYKSKEDILFELVKHVTGHFYDMVVINLDKLKSPVDYLKMFMDKDCLCGQHGDLVYNLDFWIQAMSISRIKKHMNRNFKSLVDKFVESVDSKYGRTRADRRHLAIFTFSLYDGLMVREIMDSSVVDRAKQFKLFERMLEGKISIKNK